MALILCAVTACTSVTNAASPPEIPTQLLSGTPAEHAAIRRVSDEWARRFKAGDLDGIMTLYEPDAIVMSQGRPRVVGREAIRKSFESLLRAENRAIRIAIEEIGVGRLHAWASVLAVIAYRQADGSPREYASRTFIVYKRGDGGTWRIYRDMDNATPDAEVLKAWD
jgi:uncharacterized protein (TIGR02246 family)